MNLQHYCVNNIKKIFAGEYPGSRVPANAIQNIKFLAEKGIRVFLDLTQECDGLESYSPALEFVSEEIGEKLTRINIPIKDGNVPENTQDMQNALDIIKNAISQNQGIYIHCWGGVGRTGTVVGCWLVECGIRPQYALLQVQALYSINMIKKIRLPDSPETQKQKDYIHNWDVNL